MGIPFAVVRDYIGSRILRPDAGPVKKRYPSFIALLTALISVVIWQCGFLFDAGIEKKYHDTGLQHSCGVSFSDPGHVFTYGLYYWGLFPVFPQRDILPEEYLTDDLFYSREGARKIFERYGYALRMDIAGTFRMGNVLNLWLPYLVALARGTAKGVTFIPVNAVYFIISLLTLLIFLWYMGRGLLGIILVMIIGSYPFQVYSVYAQDNIFSYSISTIVLMMAFFAPILFNAKIPRARQIFLCAIAGVWAGVAYLMRADCLAALFPCAASIMVYGHAKVKYRLLLVLVLIFGFFASSNLLHTFFSYKMNQAARIVEEKGGEKFNGIRLKNHLFWHTIWCGMCDFDKKYKHSWSDFIAEYRVKPVLKEKYGKEIGKLVYHSKPVDYYLPSKVPEYDTAMRDLVFRDIASDPLWYLGILAKRADRTFLQAVRPRIIFHGDIGILLFDNIFIFIVMIVALMLVRARGYVNLILFSLASAIVPIFVTTHENYHHYSIVNQVLAAMLIYIMIKIVLTVVPDLIRGKRAG